MKIGKLKPLSVNVDDLIEFKNTEYVLYAKCGVTKKELRLNCNGGIELWHNNTKLLETMQPYTAVEAFNIIN